MIAAELHSFRHPPSLWPLLLERVRELGATHVTTLLPWGEHEARAGEVELGVHRPTLAAGAFLDRVADAGLRAIVRIGPRVRADLSLAGLPEHVAFDRASMARSARGNPVPSPMPPRMFPWPSYASDAYRAHVRRWIETVALVLRDRLAPAGIVDAIDLEDPSAVLLRAGAYARDYHPDAIRAFHDFLRARYGSTEALSAAWGVNVARFEDVSAPTRFTADSPRDLPRHLDWACSQQSLVGEFRSFLRHELARAGLGGAQLSSALDASAIGVPANPSAAAACLDRVGVELASVRTEVAAIRRRLSPVAAASRRPFARIVVGGSPWGRPRADEDAIASALLSVAFGARELELSMGVAHERWWGAPIDVDGARTPTFARVQALITALGSLELGRLSQRPDAIVVVPPEYARLVRVTHLFGPLGAGQLDFVGRAFGEATLEGTFGFERPIQHAFLDRLSALERALEQARISFGFVDPDTAKALDPAPELVLVPTFEYLDDPTRDALAALHRRGATLVVGPASPRLDGRMDPSERELPSATLLADGTTSELAAELGALAARLGLPLLPHDPAGEAHAIPLRRGGSIVGYVVLNPGASAGSVELDAETALVDPLDGTRVEAQASVAIGAGSVRLLVAEGDARASRPPSARARRKR